MRWPQPWLRCARAQRGLLGPWVRAHRRLRCGGRCNRRVRPGLVRARRCRRRWVSEYDDVVVAVVIDDNRAGGLRRRRALRPGRLFEAWGRRTSGPRSRCSGGAGGGSYCARCSRRHRGCLALDARAARPRERLRRAAAAARCAGLVEEIDDLYELLVRDRGAVASCQMQSDHGVRVGARE